jgi:Fe-S-cluster containining protein
MKEKKMKKKGKKKSYKRQTRKSKSKNNVIPFNSGKKVVSLKQKLSNIYETTDLRTTCCGTCACCKVAMPQHNYCEFIQLLKDVWEKEDKDGKLNIICTSIEYFFRNEFEKWGMESMVKPCMLLTEDGKCKYYDSRPLSCRMYGLWPEDVYTKRVDAFEKAYEGKLKREEIPLNKQCPFVERVNDEEPLTIDTINGMYALLDNLDMKMGWTSAQVENKESYRTFHDWLLYTFFGEDWLTAMSKFVKKADKEAMVDMIRILKEEATKQFSDNMPELPAVADIEEEEIREIINADNVSDDIKKEHEEALANYKHSKEDLEYLVSLSIEQVRDGEKLNPDDFESNDHYKVRYRFVSNMMHNYKQLGFENIPTEEEAFEATKAAHVYFVWAFENDKNANFKVVYDLHKEAVEGREENE